MSTARVDRARAAARRLFCTAVVLIGSAELGWADDTIRCSGRLISTGDSAARVREACGEPDFVDEWVGERARGLGPRTRMTAWTYNRGPNRLLRTMIFDAGRLERIRDDGYGFVESRVDGRCDPIGIAPGMSKYRLVTACGPPVERRGFFIYSSQVRSGSRTIYLRRGIIPVYRERWIYDFGDNRLQREVTLEDARVVAVETLERGVGR